MYVYVDKTHECSPPRALWCDDMPRKRMAEWDMVEPMSNVLRPRPRSEVHFEEQAYPVPFSNQSRACQYTSPKEDGLVRAAEEVRLSVSTDREKTLPKEKGIVQAVLRAANLL